MLTASLNSSIVSAARFDDSVNVLEVDLTNGRSYLYFMVPREVFLALVNAPSAGAFFNREIRNRYRCERIG